MAQVSEELIKELQQIIKEDYGEELSFEQTSQVAHTWVGYFDLLAKVYHRMQQEKNNEETLV